MTRYYAQNTPRAGLEHMMMSVPGFQKRGGGMMILSRFCYKPEDVDCRYCLHYRRRSCQVRTCPYIAERLKSGAIEYLDLILEYFGHIPHAGLHKRIQAVEHWSGPDQAVLHTVSVHLRSRFADRVFADEAEALSHDLGHGGAAEQRAVIDLDNGRIRVEYDHRAGSLRESLDALANHFPTAGANRIQNRLIAFLAEHDGSEELYKTLHNELGLTNQEIEAMGFDLAHRYEPDCDDAYQDIVDYIRFEQETSKMWPWLISGDEMLAQETTLREIAGRLTAAGEWDTESIYESLTEAFGNNLSLDKQSKDDTKEEERNINIKQDQLDLLWQLEEFRKKHEHQAEPSDWAIRMCEAFVARSMGFTDRVQWTELLRQKGETLFTFDWKSGSISDHVVQWCKENNRNWRYSHLGELQVAHGGEWRKVDYFCRDGSETRVYFPPKPVQEHQLQALAEDPAIHLRDLLMLGLPDHDVYLVHAAEDVGWVPAADLPRLTAQGKEEFSALLDAKIAAIRPGPYGVELVLDGVNSQLLAQYDETLANSSRAEHAMELFL